MQYSTLRGRPAWKQQGPKTPVPDSAAARVPQKKRKAVRSHSARCEAVQRERLRHAQLLLVVISLMFPAHVPLKFVSKLLRKKMSTNCLQSSFWTCLCTLTLSLVEFTFGSNSNCCQCFINAPFAFPFKMKHFTFNIPFEGTQTTLEITRHCATVLTLAATCASFSATLAKGRFKKTMHLPR